MTYPNSLLRLAPPALLIAFSLTSLHAQRHQPPVPTGPWMNQSLSADERADLLLKQLTLEEKIELLHGTGSMGFGPPSPQGRDSNGGAGYVVGIPRFNIPGIQMADAAYGVTRGGRAGRYSTALPDNLAGAATWDLEGAYAYGALIGRELRAQGYSMSLGGGVNLTREPRNGRTFEYMGEDPVLAGNMDGQVMKGLQAQHIIGDIKHYAINDQESGRNAVNANISKRAMRESDLLAFQIALRVSDAQGVMCSYNRVNADFACENKYLLTDVLKHDFKFPGFVLSDWGGTHSTLKASAAGLDNEEPSQTFFGAPLLKAAQAGAVPMAEIDDHVHRMLRAEFASGLIDDPIRTSVVDVDGNAEIAQHLAEQSIVLLRNQRNQLPLDASRVRSIAVIGSHADIAMLSGGGSAQVDPPGGNAIAPPGHRETTWQGHIWFPDSPLKALEARAPEVKFTFDPGTDPAAAAEAAKAADVAIVFASQWESEGMDLDSLTLPDNQDALITQVAAANRHTIVVLETGSPVTMPWADQVSGILESWYSGIRGATAVANILFGEVNPSAKLPITFPKADADLPNPTLVHPPPESTEAFYGHDAGKKNSEGLPAFQVHYDEGLKVGYKWYDAEKKSVLYPFGYGLSYTTYDYSGLNVEQGADKKLTVTFNLTNSGPRAGSEVAEVYASLPESADEPPKRLIGWSKVKLASGESRQVTVEIDPLYLSVYDEATNQTKTVPGEYTIRVGGSSKDLPLHKTIEIK